MEHGKFLAAEEQGMWSAPERFLLAEYVTGRLVNGCWRKWLTAKGKMNIEKCKREEKTMNQRKWRTAKVKMNIENCKR